MKSTQSTKSVNEIIDKIVVIKETPYGSGEALSLMASEKYDEVQFIEHLKPLSSVNGKFRTYTLHVKNYCDCIYGFEYPYEFNNIIMVIHRVTSSEEYSLFIEPSKLPNGLFLYEFDEPLPIAPLINVNISFQFTLPYSDKIPYPIRTYSSFLLPKITNEFFNPLFWTINQGCKFVIDDGSIQMPEQYSMEPDPIFEHGLVKIYHFTGTGSVPNPPKGTIVKHFTSPGIPGRLTVIAPE